jgi:hypothetical protein
MMDIPKIDTWRISRSRSDTVRISGYLGKRLEVGKCGTAHTGIFIKEI